MLLQEHNLKLTQAYDILTASSVKVHSVKTDCFVVRAKDEAKARELLTFGHWHLEG